MIELGLTRITSLLRNRPLPWKAIHVAGTNGKGSICAYITAMLRAGGIRCGRFTSPHLVDRWDCINIDGKPITYDAFKVHEDFVRKRNEEENIGASEFELLTASAFEAFTASDVQVGVVEVGMGGRLDATNVLEDPLVTVIAKIAMDHQAFLGDTIEAIAREKAGIMKPNVPCIVNKSNDPSVLQVIEDEAKRIGAKPVILRDRMPKITKGQKEAWAPRWGAIRVKYLKWQDTLIDERAQRENIACAYEAVKLALPKIGYLPAPGTVGWGADPRRHYQLQYGITLPETMEKEPIGATELLPAVMHARLPGRVQFVDISPLVGRKQEIVLDGAHNADSARALEIKLNKAQRAWTREEALRVSPDGVVGVKPITWVLAFTEGKDMKEMLQLLLHSSDTIVATRFSDVDGMPWVKPMAFDSIEAVVKATFPAVTILDGGDPQQALQKASDITNGGNMTVAGSLYLVSDVLRLVPQANLAEELPKPPKKRRTHEQMRQLREARSAAMPLKKRKRRTSAEAQKAREEAAARPKRPPGRPRKHPREDG